MTDLQQVNKDILEYLNKEPNLRKEDRVEYLRALFDKHFTVNKLDYIINYGDLYEIIGDSKNVYNSQRLPMYVTRKRIEAPELPTVSITEAVLGYLTKNNLLKKSIKIDYTE